MQTSRELLVAWLRDAYAMELQSIDALERQLAHLPYGDMALNKRLHFHLEETLNQAEKIAVCIDHLGADTQGIKVGLGRLIGNMHAITTALGPYEMVKSAIVSTIFERFEICTYETLIIAVSPDTAAGNGDGGMVGSPFTGNDDGVFEAEREWYYRAKADWKLLMRYKKPGFSAGFLNLDTV